MINLTTFIGNVAVLFNIVMTMTLFLELPQFSCLFEWTLYFILFFFFEWTL